MNKISWFLPIKTVSEANRSEHWTKSSKRHKQHQFFVRQLFMAHKPHIELPCRVEMIRIGPRYLDREENLPMAFKWIKDEISACLLPDKRKFYIDKKGKKRELKGRCDDDPSIKWLYDQEKGVIPGIRIEIDCL